MTQAYDDEYGYAPGYPPDEATGPLDVVSAMIAALVTWLGGLEFAHSGDGTPFEFAEVYDEWPDGEDELDAYPVASVIPVGDIERGTYSLTPQALPDTVDGWALFIVGQATAELQLDFWASDKGQRRDIDRVIENERTPVEGTSGLLLEMANYWGQIVRVNFQRSRRWASMETARSGEFRSTWFVEAICPEIRATKRPAMDPRLQLSVGPDVEATI
ncbi:MAG: hypothetical protein KAX80_13195 [Planctomycetes bacterium]|nr:hypothetical protein [Planctomycetota bacterium]